MGYIFGSIFRKSILPKSLAKVFLHFYLIYSYIYINQKLSFSKRSVKSWIAYPQNSGVEALTLNLMLLEIGFFFF